MSVHECSTPPRLNTVGTIARDLRVPVHRVRYVLETRPYIRPAALAANTRLFDQHAVAQIRHALSAIEARRGRDEA
jgi:DNA-binding transcriptional MerR regulator